MGKDFYEKSPLAKEVFDKSCEILGQDMKHICFEENELLDRTDYTQAALVTTCMAMTKEIMARGLTPDMTAGLSLGAVSYTHLKVSIDDFPLLMHVDGLLNEHATLNIPWKKFERHM